MTAYDDCLGTGMVQRAVGGYNGGSIPNSHAASQYTAPSGTRLTRVDYDATVTNDSPKPYRWGVYAHDPNSWTGSGWITSSTGVGFSVPVAQSAYFPGGTQWMEFRIACESSGCTSNSTYTGDMRVRNVRIHHDDYVAPVHGDERLSVANGGWTNAQDITFTGDTDDSTGVKQAWAEVYRNGHYTGIKVGERWPGCHYWRARPCGDHQNDVGGTFHNVPEGDLRFHVWGVDAGDNTAASPGMTAKVDRTPPTVGSVTEHVNENAQGWSTSPTVRLTYSQGENFAPVVDGDMHVRNVKTGAAFTHDEDGNGDDTVTLPSEGIYEVRTRMKDAAGNLGAYSAPITVKYEEHAPGQANPKQRNGWIGKAEAKDFAQPINGLLPDAHSPESGVQGYAVTVSQNGSNPGTTVTPGMEGLTPTLTISQLDQGHNLVRARAISNAGRASADVGTASLAVDLLEPTVNLTGEPADATTWQDSEIDLTIKGVDPAMTNKTGQQVAGSGMEAASADETYQLGAYIEYQLDGGAWKHDRGDLAEMTVGDGDHTLIYRAYDVAGNPSVTKTAKFKVDTVVPGEPVITSEDDWVNEDEIGTFKAQIARHTTAPVGPSGIPGFSISSKTNGTPTAPDKTIDVDAGALNLGKLADGVTTIQGRAISGSGLASDIQTQEINVDTLDPTVKVAGAPTDADTWHPEQVELTITGEDPAPAAGVAPSGMDSIDGAYVEYELDGKDPVRVQGNEAVKGVGDGEHTLVYRSVDAAGNKSATKTVAFKVDSVTPGKPTLTVKNGWLNANEANSYRQQIEMGDAKVGPSGIAGYSYTRNGTEPDAVKDTAGDFTLGDLPEGETEVQAVAISRAGLVSAPAEVTLRVDRTAPDVDVQGVPAANGWTNNPVALTVSASDELAGMNVTDGEPVTAGARITYRVNGGPAQRIAGATAPIAIDTDGEHTVTFRATDAAGNSTEDRTVQVNLDRAAPTPVAFEQADADDPRKVTVAAADALSGVDYGRIQARPDGSTDEDAWKTVPGADHVKPGEDGRIVARVSGIVSGVYELRAVVVDRAGNATINDRTTTGGKYRVEVPKGETVVVIEKPGTGDNKGNEPDPMCLINPQSPQCKNGGEIGTGKTPELTEGGPYIPGTNMDPGTWVGNGHSGLGNPSGTKTQIISGLVKKLSGAAAKKVIRCPKPGKTTKSEKAAKACQLAKRHKVAKRGEQLVSTLTIPFGNTGTLRGVVLTAIGEKPIAAGTVVLWAELKQNWGASRRYFVKVGQVKTDSKGAFTYKAPKGASRVLRAEYVGDANTADSWRDHLVNVPASITIKASKKTLRNKQTLRLSGKLVGKPFPAAGKILTIQAFDKKWRTIGTTRATAKGTWKFSYRFTKTTRTRTYKFRVQAPREAAYSYATGVSKQVAVKVKG